MYTDQSRDPCDITTWQPLRRFDVWRTTEKYLDFCVDFSGPSSDKITAALLITPYLTAEFRLGQHINTSYQKSNAIPLLEKRTKGPIMSSQNIGWFTTEIQQMMHGFGDCRKPLLESASLIESIVQRQMLILLDKLLDVSQLRGSRYIGIEDILYVLQKDKVKLRRLLKYIELTDMRGGKGSTGEEDDIMTETKAMPMRKRLKVCYDFLNSIDTTGELIALFDDDGQDEVKMERMLRAEFKSRNMDSQQYIEYCEARQANFGRKLKLQKFKDWLLNGNASSDVRLNVIALEVLSYLAFETVAQVVDLSLLVKKDMDVSITDPLSSFVPLTMNHEQVSSNQDQATSTVKTSTSRPQSPISPAPSTNHRSDSLSGSTSSQSSVSSSALNNSGLGNSTTSLGSSKVKPATRRKSGTQLTSNLHSANAITPRHIKEVIRRYNRDISPFTSFAKKPIGRATQHLFCC